MARPFFARRFEGHGGADGEGALGACNAGPERELAAIPGVVLRGARRLRRRAVMSRVKAMRVT